MIELISAIMSGFAIAGALAAVFFSRRALRSSPRKRVAELELDVAELRDITDNLQTTFKKFRARDGMRRYRAEKGSDDLPNPHDDPAAWKKAMRARLGVHPVKGLNGG